MVVGEDDGHAVDLGSEPAAFIGPGSAHSLKQRRVARWRTYRAAQRHWERTGDRGWALLLMNDSGSVSGTPVWREGRRGDNSSASVEVAWDDENTDARAKTREGVDGDEGALVSKVAALSNDDLVHPGVAATISSRGGQVVAPGRPARPSWETETNRSRGRLAEKPPSDRVFPPLPIPSSKNQQRRIRFARRYMLVSRAWRYGNPTAEDSKAVVDPSRDPMNARRRRPALRLLLPPPGSGLLRFLPGVQRAERRRAGHRLFQVFRRLRAAELGGEAMPPSTASAFAGDLGLARDVPWAKEETAQLEAHTVNGTLHAAASRQAHPYVKQDSRGRRRGRRGLGLLSLLNRDAHSSSPCCERPVLRRTFYDPLRMTRLRARRWRRPLLLVLRAALLSVQMVFQAIILNLPGSAEHVRARRAAQVNALIRNHVAVAFPALGESVDAAAVSDLESVTEADTDYFEFDDQEGRSETSMHCRAEHDPDSVFVTEPEDECLTDWRPRFYGRIRDSEMAMIAGAQQCPSFWDRADDHGCLDEAVAGTGPREQPCTCKTFSGVAGAPTGKQLVQSDQSQVLPSDSKRIGRPPRNPFTRSLRWLLRQPLTASRQGHAIEPSQPRTPSGESATYARHRVDYFSIIEVGGIQTEVVVIPTSRLGVTNKPIWSGRGLSPNHKTLSVSSMDSSSTVVVAEEPQPPSLSTLTSSRSDWLMNRERTTTTIKRTGDMLGEATEKDPWFRRIVSETARETDSDPNTWTERVVVDERHQHRSRSPTSTPRTVRTREHRKVSIGYPSQLESDQGNQVDAAWTESDGSGTLPVSIPSPNQVRRRQCQVVFFPGNPGCIELYESFLLNCASVLAHAAHPNYEFIVHGVGLAGHDLRGLNRPGRFFDLADQTRHKLAYIREHLHWGDGSNDDALILVGHSTGAHIICRLLEEDPVLAQRAQVILLTPAIADVADGIRTAFRQRAFIFQRGARQVAAGLASTILHIAPERMVDDLVDEFLAHRATPTIARRIRDLFRLAADKYHLFINILALAADKCLHIGDMNISLLRRFASRLVMYYVPDDPFAPPEQCARVRLEIPEALVEFEQQRVYHGFILNEHQTQRVASKVAHWVLEAVCSSTFESEADG